MESSEFMFLHISAYYRIFNRCINGACQRIASIFTKYLYNRMIRVVYSIVFIIFVRIILVLIYCMLLLELFHIVIYDIPRLEKRETTDIIIN